METGLGWTPALLLLALSHVSAGCMFFPAGEYLRFVRIPENVPVGGEVLQVEVHPRKNLSLRPVDKADDARYFAVRDVNGSAVSIVLARSLEDLVDSDTPHNVLKFRLVCDYQDGDDTISSYLSVTVYVEDINDHAPKFIDAPYHVTVDELTPTGLTIFRGIHAVDRDKPNTPNSDVQYSIVGGNEAGKFGLESAHRAALVIRKALDYDTGDKEFTLTLMASDRGTPPLNSTTHITVTVLDSDDLSPRFTRELYRTQVTEFYPLTGTKVHKELVFRPPIEAFDQDVAIDAAVRYDIIAGNERRLFRLDPRNGSLFLERELDLDAERTLPGNTFSLTVQAAQVDNPLKAGVARVEVELLDLNDNLPEFEVDLYNISIVENLPNGFSVLQVVATDKDQGDNAFFTYQLEDPVQAFNIDSRTGWLTVRDQGRLDRERQPMLNMRVRAKEKTPSVVKGSDSSSYVNVTVTLLDANDNNPSFVPSNLYEFTAYSDASIGDVVGQVKAIDPDLGRNGMVLYDVQRTGNLSTSALPFVVDAQTGEVSVADAPLSPGRHALFVEASDQPANPSERRFSLAVVSVDVLKAGRGEQVPDFIGAPYEFWVGSNVGIGTSVGQIRVTDAPDTRRLVYDLLHSYHEGVPFAVEERSGTITVVAEMRKYERTLYDFEAVATDSRDMVLVTNVTIHVVHPEDEIASLFRGGTSTAPRRPMEFHVRENLAGALVGQLLSSGRNVTSAPFNNSTTTPNKLRFVIANQQDVADRFAISADGTLYTQRGLDREERDSYRLTVIAENAKGLVRGSGVFQVTVVVEDENDNPPVFEHNAYEGRIPENATAGTEVEMDEEVRAKDADTGGNAQFTMSLYGEGRDVFALDTTTGTVTLRQGQALDRETKAVYHLRVIARDKGGLTSEAVLTIHVDDVNDNAPRFVRMSLLQDEGIEVNDPEENDIFVVDQNGQRNGTQPGQRHVLPVVSVPESVSVGSTLLKLFADDRDTGVNAVVAYKITAETQIPNDATSSHGHFKIAPSTGELQVSRTLPAETEFQINVTATDGGGLSDSVILKVYVKDVNDHAPAFVRTWYNFDLPEGVYTNHVLGKLEAVDADFGTNANISYYIMQTYEDFSTLPFHISEQEGVLTVDGDIDREVRDSYSFQVVAQDHGLAEDRKRSTVDVEIHVTDINDNPPMFYGYDRIAQVTDDDGNSAFVPVYYTSVVENSPIGQAVARVFANDSDFQGNGNGLVLYDIPRRLDHDDFFTMDSKEGVITTNAKLDYETQSSHNVTVVARDLGRPSLSSTALLVVGVVDVPETLEDTLGPMFMHRYYEVEVEENCAVPIALLTLNVTEPYRGYGLKYTIVPGKRAARGLASSNAPPPRVRAPPPTLPPPTTMFRVDTRNGTLLLTESPDRELRSRYEVTVRVDFTKKGRAMGAGPHLLYPVSEERLTDLAPNEVKVVVRVTDVNDNPPKFTVSGRPIVAAIPATAHYGYQIVKLQAKDPDEGLNAEVRYQILDRVDDESHKFAVDPVTGQVRSIVSFSRDAGRVFGFDVKATDRRGSDDGKTAIANVFVYVLDEEKQLVMMMASRPIDVETNMENVTQILSNATGMDVRVRKLQPRIDDSFYSPATDVYLYAVDPVMNVIIDMDSLSHLLNAQQAELRRRLPALRSVDLVGGGLEVSRAEAHALSALEVAVVVLGCVVFLGALAAAVCVGCVRRFRHHKSSKESGHSLGLSMGLKSAHSQPLTHSLHHKAQLYPSASPSFFSITAAGAGLGGGPGPALSSVGGGGDTTDTYVEMHSNKSSNCNKRRYPTTQRTRRSTHHRHQHEPTCTRHKRHRRRASNAQGMHMVRSNSNTAFDIGMGSPADSGQVLFEERDRDLGCCPCGHSPSHSSAESSNGSYEDSLKSSRHTCGHGTMAGVHSATTSRTNRHHQRQREAPQMIATSRGTLGGTPLSRRQSERVIMCPMQS